MVSFEAVPLTVGAKSKVYRMYRVAFFVTLLKITNKCLQIGIPCESSVMLLQLPSCVHGFKSVCLCLQYPEAAG